MLIQTIKDSIVEGGGGGTRGFYVCYQNLCLQVHSFKLPGEKNLESALGSVVLFFLTRIK